MYPRDGFTRPTRLTRRQILSALGYAGAAQYLPSLAGNAEGAPVIPRRFLFFYTFHSNTYPNWIMRPPGMATDREWEWNLNPLAATELSDVYAPLHAHRSKVLILDSLSNAANLSDGEPQGHHGGPATILTSSRYMRGADIGASGTEVLATAPSLDQIIADKIAVPGRIRTVETGSRIGNYGPIWQGPGKALPSTSDATKVFARLFPTGMTTTVQPPGPSTAAEPTPDQKIAASEGELVGFTKDRFSRLATRLGRTDREKIEAHRDLLRNLELRLGAGGALAGGAGAAPGAGCPSKPAAPAASTSIHQRVDDLGRVIATAFACDITRVASLQINMMAPADFGWTGGSDVHAGVCHHNGDAEKVRWMGVYYRKHSEHFAGILRHLDSIPEADGKTLLDHTIVLWAPECGSSVHQTGHLPLVLAGGGGFRMGRYLYWPSTVPRLNDDNYSKYPLLPPPHSRLLVSIARQFGLDINQVGNVTTGRGMSCLGPLERLL